MRRVLLLLTALILTACRPVTPVPVTAAVAEPTAIAGLPAIGNVEPGYSVVFHPDGPLYVGDLVSLVVVAPSGQRLQGRDVRAAFGERGLGAARFEPHDIGGRAQAVLPWAWDTAGLAAGSYALSFSIHPDGPSWRETVSLLPRADLPPEEADARWASVTSRCCTINYITGTAAERDSGSLAAAADVQAADVASSMHAEFHDKIPVTFIPRTMGHGGFTADAIYITYSDRNYAGSTAIFVLHHEMVHWLDGQLGGDSRPTIFVEGLAVYITGGHFKPEPLFPRAAALLESGGLTPVRELADNFYPSQHEAGYLEAGSLTGYLIEKYGWDSFNDFYRNIRPVRGGRPSQAIDAALNGRLHVTLERVEQDYLAFLRAQPVDDPVRTDLRLSMAFYDSVRRYQQLLDPSAYYLTAWLPDAAAMRQRGIVADYLRHPDSPVNAGLETLLVDADRDLRGGQYAETERLLQGVHALLDILDGSRLCLPVGCAR